MQRLSRAVRVSGFLLACAVGAGAASAAAALSLLAMDGDKTRQSSRDEWVKIDGHPLPTAARDGQSSAWIRVGQLPLGGSMNQSAPAAGKVKWIEIQGWDWETEPAGPAVFKGELTGIEPGYDAGSAAAPDKFGRVRVKFAWDGCARGARLPALELRDARTLYRLEDVSVAACAADGATFRYARLRRSPVPSLAR